LEMPLAHHVFLLLHTLLLAVGAFLLLREPRCSPLAAFAGAAALGLSQKNATYLLAGWDTVSAYAAYVPLALLLLLRSMRGEAWRARAALGVVLVLAARAGYPPVVAFLALALLLVGLLRIDWTSGERRRRG